MEKEIKNLESSNSNIGVDPYWEVRREAFRNGYDAAESDYWKKFRREAAKDALCAIIVTQNSCYQRTSFAGAICDAIKAANELIKQLKEEENGNSINNP